MKIILLSDSHGNTENVNRVVNNYAYDHLFFLGDGIADLGNLIYADNVKYVKGNCDFFSKEPVSQMVTLLGKRFLLIHGHTESVKSGFGGLVKLAKEVKADFVFFGHTHQYYLDTIDGITFCNPGSISTTRGGKQTFVVLEMDEKKTLFNRIEF